MRRCIITHPRSMYRVSSSHQRLFRSGNRVLRGTSYPSYADLHSISPWRLLTVSPFREDRVLILILTYTLFGGSRFSVVHRTCLKPLCVLNKLNFLQFWTGDIFIIVIFLVSLHLILRLERRRVGWEGGEGSGIFPGISS